MLKTKVEIIEETVEYYKKHNRAIIGHQCYYLSEKGDMCAVGRCLKDPKNFINCLVNAKRLFELKSFDILKDDYKIEDFNFWSDLQNLHDGDDYWSDNELSYEGRCKKKELIAKYENN